MSASLFIVNTVGICRVTINGKSAGYLVFKHAKDLVSFYIIKFEIVNIIAGAIV